MARIAIVDDEDDILRILERFLGRRFEVVSYNNPVIALQEIQNGNFDLVLSDIMMPQIDGLTLLKRLRENNCDVKVIMMTAFDTLERALEAHKYGAKKYIKKPFKSLEDVEEKIIGELNS
jgi:DNA-binding NtrC family response regulator